MTYILETPRLLLREVQPTDMAGLLEMDSDPAVAKYVGNQPLATTDSGKALEIIQFIRAQYSMFGMGRWSVLLQETREFIGWCGLKCMHNTMVNGYTGFVDIGYRFSKKHWGKGYATEAAAATLDYGFSQLHLSEIFAFADVRNTASLHVLTKIGMHRKNDFDWEGDACTWFEARIT